MPTRSMNPDILHATGPVGAFCGVRGGAHHAVAALPRRLWVLLSTWHARAAQRRALAALDRRLRRDVGLTPDCAAAESQKPFWRA
ncbi:MAG: DUF1127 domain-containing protein [Kiloniellales bacterium]